MITVNIFEKNKSDLGGGLMFNTISILILINNQFLQNQVFNFDMIGSCSAVIISRAIYSNILIENLYFLNSAENKGV